MTQYVGLDVSLKEKSFTYLMKQAIEFGVVDARPIPQRSLQQCAGTLPVRPVLDSRLDH
jgi:hypothetical protein